MMAGDGRSPDLRSRFASDLGPRAASAVVMAAAALGTAFWGGWPLVLFWAAAGIAISVEWTTMARVGPQRPVQIAQALAIAAAAAAAGPFQAAPWVITVLIAAGIAASLLLPRTGRDRSWAVAGFLCAVVVATEPVALRLHPAWGVTGLLWMFAVVWGTDIAAYFTGRTFGGPKLMPRVSPKKTWSGFAGGLIVGTAAGVGVAVAASRLGWNPPIGVTTIAIVSAIASILGQIGDLAESALKRHFDVKDSSRLIPGHGGVMDRLDAFFAVALLAGILLIAGRLAET
jgi:phosphatidate cytidylyltransferase